MLILRRSKLYFTASGMSLSVSGRAVHRLRADCSPLSTGAYYCSKHVEVSNVIHILQNKGIVHQVGNKTKFSYTNVHENPTNNVGVDTETHRNELAWHRYEKFFCFLVRKERLLYK
jgi:hypothetical protein